MLEKELKVLNYIVRKKNEYFNEVINSNRTCVTKCSILSEQARKTGDHLLKNFSVEKHTAYFHLLAFKHYCRSILLAPSESQYLVFAYESLSDLLFHVGYYEHCIQSISHALKIVKLNRLKIKLLLRKAECMEKMGIKVNETISKGIKSYFDKLDDKTEQICIDQISENLSLSYDSLFSSEDCSSQMKGKLDSINIKSSKKFGMCLETTQDFQPGDIIFVEKPNCVFNNLQTSMIHCNYCLNSAWSGIPCEFCNWAIFCSEECKKKAWDAYHDLECCVIPLVEIANEFSYVQLSIRTIITSIKEAGGISLLRNKLKTVDEHSDPCLDFQDGNYSMNLINFIKSYKSKFPKVDHKWKKEATIIMSFLIALVQRTKLIENFSYENIDDFLHNKDLIFIGSLMLKLSALIRNEGFSFQICNRTKACNFGNTSIKCQEVSCCSKGLCLAPLTSWIHQKKFPNVAKCCTENNKIVIFAVQPIKKGDQIFIIDSPHFHATSTEFQEKLLKEHNETNVIKQSTFKSMSYFNNFSMHEEEPFSSEGIVLEKQISQDFSDIFDVFLQFMITNNVDQSFEKLDIDKLSIVIQDLLRKLPQASKSYVTYSLIQSLEMAVTRVYGIKPQSLNKCNPEFD